VSTAAGRNCYVAQLSRHTEGSSASAGAPSVMFSQLCEIVEYKSGRNTGELETCSSAHDGLLLVLCQLPLLGLAIQELMSRCLAGVAPFQKGLRLG
jgi:hypothetical protein